MIVIIFRNDVLNVSKNSCFFQNIIYFFGRTLLCQKQMSNVKKHIRFVHTSLLIAFNVVCNVDWIDIYWNNRARSNLLMKYSEFILSGNSDFIIRFNLSGKVKFPGSKSLG